MEHGLFSLYIQFFSTRDTDLIKPPCSSFVEPLCFVFILFLSTMFTERHCVESNRQRASCYSFGRSRKLVNKRCTRPGRGSRRNTIVLIAHTVILCPFASLYKAVHHYSDDAPAATPFLFSRLHFSQLSKVLFTLFTFVFPDFISS